MNLVFSLLMVLCQATLNQDTVKNVDTTYTSNIPIMVFLADGRKFETKNLIIDNNDIDSLIIPPKDSRTALYGTIKNGIMLIKVKRRVNLVSFYGLLKKYKIPDKYFALPVIVDNLVVEKPETMFADLKAIRRVMLVKQQLKNQMKISITTIYLSKNGNGNEKGKTVVLK